jgi:heme-degrading monooxygenase HmoA
MIARIWHGRTKAEHADEYVDYVNRTGVEQQRRTPGNLGSLLLRRVSGGEAHFLVVSFWESMAAIEAFAGERPEVAVYYPQDEGYLLELESEVVHWEVSVAELAATLTAAAGTA